MGLAAFNRLRRQKAAAEQKAPVAPVANESDNDGPAVEVKPRKRKPAKPADEE